MCLSLLYSYFEMNKQKCVEVAWKMFKCKEDKKKRMRMEMKKKKDTKKGSGSSSIVSKAICFFSIS